MGRLGGRGSVEARDEIIRKEAQGARTLIMGLDEDGQLVLRFDIGVSKASAVDALIDGGLERSQK